LSHRSPLRFVARSSAARRALLLGLAAALAACGGRDDRRRAESAAAAAVSATDDAGRTVRLAAPARRIVSLIPSGTETLVALGAAEQVVGRTDYDTDPAVAALPSVGGGLDPSAEAVLALRPDLVITWESDRSLDLRRRLAEAGIATFALRTRDTADVFRNVERLGRLAGRDSAAAALAARIRSELAAVRASVAGRPAPTVLFVVWPDPPQTAGPETFIAQVIGVAGGRTAFPDLAQDWPQLSLEAIVRRQPDVVLLPVGETRHTAAMLHDAPGWRDLAAVREGRVAEVPADLVNRPGPHLAAAARAVRDALQRVAGDGVAAAGRW